MDLNSAVELNAYGTSEGVTKEWDSRGRGRKKTDKSVHPNNPTDDYEERVRTYEKKGASRSDAQSIVDVEVQKEKDARSKNRWADVGDQQQSINNSVKRMNIAGDQTVAHQFLTRASHMGPVNTPERLDEVEKLVPAIAKVDGAPQPGLHHLGEAIQYQSSGGIKNFISETQKPGRYRPELDEAPRSRAQSIVNMMKKSKSKS